MTVIVKYKVYIISNYKEPTVKKFDDCTSKILKNLGKKIVLTARVIHWKITDGQETPKHEAETCWNNSNKTTAWISLLTII